MNTAWWLLGWLLTGAVAFRFGRFRNSMRHQTPFLHDTPAHHDYQKRTLRPTHELVWDLDGVPWDKAPLPKSWHRCRAQTCTIYSQGIAHRDRCACGGERWGVFGKWTRRDSRCLSSGSDSSSASHAA